MGMDQVTMHMVITMDICLLIMELSEAALVQLGYLHTISLLGSTAEDHR
jgi:hypothetical protein